MNGHDKINEGGSRRLPPALVGDTAAITQIEAFIRELDYAPDRGGYNEAEDKLAVKERRRLRSQATDELKKKLRWSSMDSEQRLFDEEEPVKDPGVVFGGIFIRVVYFFFFSLSLSLLECEAHRSFPRASSVCPLKK